MRRILERVGPGVLVLAAMLTIAACGGTHAGLAPTTRVLRTSLPDATDTVARLRTAARAQGCVVRGGREATTRVFASCGEIDVLFAAGPWKNVLSVQCAETIEDAACGVLAERIAGAAMRLASVAPPALAVHEPAGEGEAR